MKRFADILAGFENKKVVVIGDVMLDKYLEGEVLRISPEAPVPIVNIKKEFYELGGAGNVAANVSSLGGDVFLFGFIGRDNEAEILKKLFKEKRINYFLDENDITIQKTRVIGKGQQLIRFDKEDTSEKQFSEEIKRKISEKAAEANIIIISDYAKGAITPELMTLLSPCNKKIIVDPKPKNKEIYKGVFLIKSNEKEAKGMSGLEDINLAGELLKKEFNSNIIITRGEKGMSLFSEKNLEIPTYAREVYDVTGAGDSVIATLGLALASNASIEEAAILANHAAGIVVGKKGTYAVSLKELKDSFFSEERKILNVEELKKVVDDYKRKGKKIVWTNGCFDLLHTGHIRYLQDAKKLGDLLIIGLNSDDSIKRLKGEGRPIQSQEERAEILSSLEFVDYLIIFSELSVEKYLAELKPNLYVKGGDYKPETINQDERKAVMSYNGEIKFIPFVEGKSTSKIIEKIKNGKF